MAIEFKLPELGEGITEADIADVLVSIGDTIAKDQPVIEAETDKAAVEIPSDVAGKVVSINVRKGDTVDLGALSQRLVQAGYSRAPTAEDPGSFAVRGGIVDIFPPLSERPDARAASPAREQAPRSIPPTGAADRSPPATCDRDEEESQPTAAERVASSRSESLGARRSLLGVGGGPDERPTTNDQRLTTAEPGATRWPRKSSFRSSRE